MTIRLIDNGSTGINHTFTEDIAEGTTVLGWLATKKPAFNAEGEKVSLKRAISGVPQVVAQTFNQTMPLEATEKIRDGDVIILSVRNPKGN